MYLREKLIKVLKIKNAVVIAGPIILIAVFVSKEWIDILWTHALVYKQGNADKACYDG